MAEDDSEERWWEPSDTELEDLIEDRLADGPLGQPATGVGDPSGFYVGFLIVLILLALGNNTATDAADNLCGLLPVLVILVFLIYMKTRTQG